jgi:xanthine/uracil permease
MRRILAYILMAVGVCLIGYFGYVFALFNSHDNPLLEPLVTGPVLTSIGFVGLGVIAVVIGIWLRLSLHDRRAQ